MHGLLDRFLRYVQVETTAVEETDQYPSSPGQFELGRMLVGELKELGLADAQISEHGIVSATIPATVPGAPTIAWFAHLDTSPEASGKGVQPQVIREYDGQDIVLPGDPSKVIKVAETAELAALRGKTLITTDGTTLLGADDKSGVAVIMTATAELLRDTSTPHGDIRVMFTVDEEVGRGPDKVDLTQVNATAGYTLDGEGVGIIEGETFSADLAIVTVTGINIHPGLAYGRMVNAIRVAGEFLEALPRELSPERTRDRAGFVHPYAIEGGVPEVKIRILLRDFETAKLAQHADVLRAAAEKVAARNPGATIDVAVRKQYRNMREHLEREPRALGLAVKALQAVGLEPKFESIRGGTDGSQFSEKGLPTPNLSAGMHNYHSPLEFAVLEEMETAVRMLVALAGLWGAERA